MCYIVHIFFQWFKNLFVIEMGLHLLKSYFFSDIGNNIHIYLWSLDLVFPGFKLFLKRQCKLHFLVTQLVLTHYLDNKTS